MASAVVPAISLPPPMDGGEPDPKKQRVGEQYKRVTRDTFVEAMLVSISTTLASDSEYGHNPANRIRRRVEDITNGIDDQSKDPTRSSSRAVLESRFALGADDSQYLTQAVSLLWAGDGGEKLRIAPLASMPEIMRVASTRGMLGAMKDVVSDRKAASSGSIKRGLRLASWILQVEDVRNAVCLSLTKGEMGEDAERIGKKVQEAFTQSMQTGIDVVESLHANDKNGEAKALCVALLMLVDERSQPGALVDTLMRAVHETVQNTKRDSSRIYHAALALSGTGNGRVIGSTGRPSTHDDQYTSTNTDNPALREATSQCSQKTFTGQPVTTRKDVVVPTFVEFATALAESVRRICNKHNSYESNSSKVWKETLRGVVTPFLQNAQTTAYWNEFTSVETDSGASVGVGIATNADVSKTLKRLISEQSRNRIDPIPTSVPDGTGGMHDVFVQFCVIRGLCGFRGPHQVHGPTGSKAAFLPYNYPTTISKEYRKTEYFKESKQRPSAEFERLFPITENRLYDTDLANDALDTDFFGNSTKEENVVSRFTYSGEKDDKTEDARRALWLPMTNVTTTDTFEVKITYDRYSQSVCEASVYEFMAESLKKPNMSGLADKTEALMKAAAAVAKLRQLEPMAYVKSNNPGDMMYDIDQMKGSVCVTRPCQTCKVTDAPYSHEQVKIPVDCGTAIFVTTDSSTGAPGSQPQSDGPLEQSTRVQHPAYASKQLLGGAGVAHELLSNALTVGMRFGWKPPPKEDQELPPLMGEDEEPDGFASVRIVPRGDSFTLFIGAAADGDPINVNSDVPRYNHDGSSKMLPLDVGMKCMFNVLTKTINEIDALEQLNCEESYVERISREDSTEMREVFGLHRNIEDASRDRRADIWTDAIREVAISGDRLYRFVTTLTGAIGEAADSAISWEDEDLKARAKEAATRQKALAERVSRFQTKLVENVVSSTLRSSKLQLDVRERADAGNELVVLSTDVKDSIRQITSGEAGHGFFEASVELNSLMGNTARPITIKDLVGRLRMVSEEFQEQIQHSMALSIPISYSRVAEPRNSFMMHLKPDTSAAIQKAFDLITSELRVCSGYHRHVHLWEFIEGKDWVMTTRFAELVGLMLQNTRMRSGSFAAYVGTHQIITNTQNVRMQIQRLKSQACHYLANAMDYPMFLQKHGRTMYFGGTIAHTKDDTAHEIKRTRHAKDAPSFGGDGGDGGDGGTHYWAKYRGTQPFSASDALKRHVLDLTHQMSQGLIDPETYELTADKRIRLYRDPSTMHAAIGAQFGELVVTVKKIVRSEVESLVPRGGKSVLEQLGPVVWLMHASNQMWIDQLAMQYDYTNINTGYLHGWPRDMSQQIEKRRIRRPKGERFFSRPETLPMDGARYYVVNIQITPTMLERYGDDRNTINVGEAHKRNDIARHVDRCLNVLFGDLLGDTNTWMPHPRWIGGNAKYAGMWVKKKQSQRDEQQHEELRRGVSRCQYSLWIPGLVSRKPGSALSLIIATMFVVSFLRDPAANLVDTIASYVGLHQPLMVAYAGSRRFLSGARLLATDMEEVVEGVGTRAYAALKEHLKEAVALKPDVLLGLVSIEIGSHLKALDSDAQPEPERNAKIRKILQDFAAEVDGYKTALKDADKERIAKYKTSQAIRRYMNPDIPLMTADMNPAEAAAVISGDYSLAQYHNLVAQGVKLGLQQVLEAIVSNQERSLDGAQHNASFVITSEEDITHQIQENIKKLDALYKIVFRGDKLSADDTKRKTALELLLGSLNANYIATWSRDKLEGLYKDTLVNRAYIDENFAAQNTNVGAQWFQSLTAANRDLFNKMVNPMLVSLNTTAEASKSTTLEDYLKSKEGQFIGKEIINTEFFTKVIFEGKPDAKRQKFVEEAMLKLQAGNFEQFCSFLLGTLQNYTDANPQAKVKNLEFVKLDREELEAWKKTKMDEISDDDEEVDEL